MKKPEITLKNIKYYPGMSQETNAYSATVYVDGKRWATVENNGGGGPDNFHPIEGGWKAVNAMNDLIGETHPKWVSPISDLQLDKNLEIVCSELLEEFQLKKDFKKALKRICYATPDEEGLYQLPTKYKPTPEALAHLKKEVVWAKNAIFLNELPEDEALKLFKEKV